MNREEFERWLSEKKHAPEDVTEEYLTNAKPGKGNITYDEGYDKETHKEEVAMAQWIHQNLGGDINLLDEVRGYKVLTPDYLWNKKLWDLKTVTTEKSANSAVRHGLKQIQENSGGIILNYEDRDVSLDVLQQILSKRLAASAQQTVDILIVQSDKVLKALRYKK
jgi:hypothetical protein|nr:MAG TPA_asm: CDI toxin-like protein [Caudoviricetes sp.]